jgi:hypothetical protein
LNIKLVNLKKKKLHFIEIFQSFQQVCTLVLFFVDNPHGNQFLKFVFSV